MRVLITEVCEVIYLFFLIKRLIVSMYMQIHVIHTAVGAEKAVARWRDVSGVVITGRLFIPVIVEGNLPFFSNKKYHISFYRTLTNKRSCLGGNLLFYVRIRPKQVYKVTKKM